MMCVVFLAFWLKKNSTQTDDAKWDYTCRQSRSDMWVTAALWWLTKEQRKMTSILWTGTQTSTQTHRRQIKPLSLQMKEGRQWLFAFCAIFKTHSLFLFFLPTPLFCSVFPLTVFPPFSFFIVHLSVAFCSSAFLHFSCLLNRKKICYFVNSE